MITTDDIKVIGLNNDEIEYCVNFYNGMGFNTNSHVYSNRTQETHNYNSYSGKWGEYGYSKYANCVDEFISRTDKQFAEKNKKLGDGGIDFSPNIDIKTSTVESYWKFNNLDFYCPIQREFHKENIYVKTFILRDEAIRISNDLDNKHKKLFIFIVGWVSGSSLTTGSDVLDVMGNLTATTKLKNLEPMTCFPYMN